MRHAVLLIILLLAFCSLLASCNQLKHWRNGQIQQSRKIAQGSAVTPPAQPPSVPDSVREQLPLDASFTILSYSGGGSGTAPSTGGTVSLTALSAWDATATAQWLVAKLGALGYDSGDNPSRVLDGAEYHRDSGDYHTLYVKLSLNTAEQCTVELRASP